MNYELMMGPDLAKIPLYPLLHQLILHTNKILAGMMNSRFS